MMQHNEGFIFILKQKKFWVDQTLQAARQTSYQYMKFKGGIPKEISVVLGGARFHKNTVSLDGIYFI